jgi:hypothetical protein
MPKRSRYDHVTVVNGHIQIYASDTIYTFETIKQWDSYETTGWLNPEITEYILDITCESSRQMIRCKDKKELSRIIYELSDQNI